MINEYYKLTKPGIVYGNLLTALAGYLFAAHGTLLLPTCFAMLGGMIGVMASACVVNNYFDRDIDARMERTKDRALVAARISGKNALLFAAVLLLIGIFLLGIYVNWLTLAVALFGWLVYVAVYTPLKKVSEHAVVVGAVAGATPPVVGYVALANTLDSTALLFFIILVSWQMVHFCAIAIYRIEEYRAAGVPVFPLRQGVRGTQAMMLAHAIVFLGCVKILALTTALSSWYLLALGVLAVGWVAYGAYGFKAADKHAWAKKNFFFSLVMLLGFCLVLSLP